MTDVITGNKTRLRDKKLSDAQNDYRWQTDAELADLDAALVLRVPFSKFLADYASVLRHPIPHRYGFAVETVDSKHIGNCTCYDIDEAKGGAQVGIIIGDRDYWNQGYGTDAMTSLVDYIFLHTSLDRLYLKSLEWNERAHKSFQKCGFTPCGRLQQDGYSFILMELHRQQWEGSRVVKREADESDKS